MLLRFLLVFGTLQYGFATMCPSFYEDGGNGYCYRAYPGNMTRHSGSLQCNADGGQLATATNAFVNTYLKNLATNNHISAFWLGILCHNSSLASCQVDNSNSSLAFHRFVPGSPNILLGPYVFMDAFSGSWFSAGYSNFSYICQVVKRNATAFCSSGKLNTKLNKCYTEVPPNNQSVQESKCQADGGHLTSIHSAQENSFVWSSFPEMYLRIGLVADINNQLTWTDGTLYNSSEFTGFGIFNPNWGKCVSLSYQKQVVDAQQWVSSGCDEAVSGVCKKDVLYQYNYAPPVPLSSSSCYNTTSLTNSGTVTSPGYPSYYFYTTCPYILTVDTGVVSLTFVEYYLKNGDMIEIYNGVADSTPAYRLRSADNVLGKTYNSTGRIMKIMFYGTNTAGFDAPSYNFNWMAYFYGAQ